MSRRVDDYGTTTALLLQLVVTLSSGETLTFGTDETWRSTSSHILRADLIAGEVHDLRQRVAWHDWPRGSSVRVEDHGYAQLSASPAPPVRQIEELRPDSVRDLTSDRSIVDVGQNINGWVRLRGLGPAGQRDHAHLRRVARQGRRRHAGPRRLPGLHRGGSSSPSRSTGSPLQASTARCSSLGTAPRAFSTSGSRATTERSPPTTSPPSSSTPISTPIGAFECSDDRINRLHHIAEWSFRDNACDIPTDCPTRERAGWTGDWQIFIETAAFLYDVHGFTVKWLRDLAAEQRPDGKVTNLVPESHPGDARPPGHWPLIEGSAGWGDAAVHVPWVLLPDHRRHPGPDRPVGVDAGVGRLRRPRRRHPAPRVSGGPRRRTGAARALPLGQRMALR